MRLLAAPLLAGSIALAGCVFDIRPPSPMTGTYIIPGGCKLLVDETGATAGCPNTKVDIALAGGTVTVTRVALTRTEKNTECWDERTCTRTYAGKVERTAAGSADPNAGRLARLAGTWKGTLTRKVSCSVEKPKSGAPPYCKKSRKDVTYTFTAVIGAHDATITWSADSGEKGSFKALETKGGVRVADTLYKRAGGEGR